MTFDCHYLFTTGRAFFDICIDDNIIPDNDSVVFPSGETVAMLHAQCCETRENIMFHKRHA